MKKLKVLISAFACNPDEASQIFPGEDYTGWNFIKQMSRFHDLWVIAHSYNKQGIEKKSEREISAKINFNFVELPFWFQIFNKVEFGKRIYYWLWQMLAFKRAKELHEEIHFEVAHHVTFGNDWIPSYIGAYMSIPFIWGPLGGGQKIPKGFLKELSLYGRFAEKVRGAAQWIGRKHYIRKRCLKQASAILVCNLETKEMIPEEYHDKTHFFPVNGISYNGINSRILRKMHQNPYQVLTAGRLHRLKGFALAIKSFKAFSEKFPESEFVIVGRGAEDSRLRTLAQDLGIGGKVRFIQWIPRKELYQMMHFCDVFLFLSFRDGGGSVVVEAMASGTPVVCLDIGGPGYHIQEEWGFKINPENPKKTTQETAKALETLHLDRDLRVSMGKEASLRAKKYYEWDRLGEQLDQIYKKILAKENTKHYF